VRIFNLDGRAVLLRPDGAGIDVADASDNRFPHGPQALLDVWDDFVRWAESLNGGGDIPLPASVAGPPVPAPRQVFAIGLNYDEHIAESSMGRPESPTVFTKFPTSITGPRAEVRLPSEHVDWEVELVVAIGRRAHEVPEARGWDHVAGLMVGQDLSERVVQLAGPVPQFSLGKSYPGFAPIGPALVTPDELADPDDLEIGCSLDGEVLQSGRTKDLIFSIPELIGRLSSVCPLLPGDLIFTGTPSGVGNAREPKRFLTSGSILLSHVEGIGEIENRMVSSSDLSVATV
jgi:2-keto-4-pentenoate hydratase/2-oxohepta-3-ene-1,7-dioic acid hydratase in catechol pathway